MSKNSFLLVDGFSVAFRAFYAIPPNITLPDGQIVNMVFGFATMLCKSLDQIDPKYLCVCFDRKEPTYRHDIFKDYKAHRPPPPDIFVQQIPILKKMLQDMGIPCLEMAGYEADDLMGTLSLQAHDQHIENYLLTSDQDAYQLVSEHTSILTSQKGTADLVILTPKEVEEKLGMGPEKVIDIKALKGDSSDNIPGVAGVGEKTAVNLLKDYPSLESIYENLDKIKSEKLKEKLINNKDMAFLSKQLVTIDRYVPIEPPFQTWEFQPRWEDIVKIFQEFKFNRLVERYSVKLNDSDESTAVTIEKKTPDGSYRLLKSEKELKALLPQLENGFAIDLETTSKNAVDAQIVGVALSVKAGEAFYIAMNTYVQKEKSQESSLFGDEVMETHKTLFQMNPLLTLLKPVIENESISKITHHGKYEIQVFKNYDINLKGISFDTMLASHLLFPGDKVGLKDVTLRHLDIQMTAYEDVAGKGKEQIRFDDVPIDQAVNYAAADADMTLRLKELFEEKIKEKELETLFYTIELPCQDVLAQMEWSGVSLDSDYLRELQKEFEQRLTVIKKKIFEIAGKEFNLNSPKQLSVILYDELNLTVYKKTKTGRSTDSSVLEKLKNEHPIAEQLAEYRMLEKLMGTYVKALPLLVNPRTKKLHTSFNQTIAITGRLSSITPNLQNIPIRTGDGIKIRNAFIPTTKDGSLLSCDYSQIELRIMAHLSKDENMINAFREGQDIHAATASIIYQVPLDDVSKELRYKAKAVNFGIIYGISPYGLSQNLNIPQKEAKEIIENYFLQFPKIKNFMEDTITFAENKGYVRTEFGRYRPLPEIHDRIKTRKQFAERTAINTRVQGTAAEIMKIGMINVAKSMQKKSFKSKMVIQVHDELVFDVVAGEESTLEALVIDEMESAVSISVPLKVDSEKGKTWLETS